MSGTLAGKLAPLAARMRSAVRTHEVLRVAGTLQGSNAEDAVRGAVGEVLRWATGQAGAEFPQAAWTGESFDLPIPGRDPSAVRFRSAGADLWAFRINRPDRDVTGRTWSTEVVLGYGPEQPARFSARLLTATDEPELSIRPTVPGFVVQIASASTLFAGSQRALHVPTVWHGSAECADLLAHLIDPGRELPTIALSVAEGSAEPALDASVLARSLAGLAHVGVIGSEAGWELTRRLSKRLSVFGGAVRIYHPGFSPTADPFAHPLVLAQALADPGSRDRSILWLQETVARSSLQRTRLGQDVLGFAAIRAAEAELRASSLGAHATQAEQIEAQRAQIAALEARVAALEAENAYYVDDAATERERAEAAEARARGAEGRILDLTEQLRSSGTDPDAGVTLPKDWSEFADWCARHLAGRVVPAPRARRMVRAPLYNSPRTAARSLIWLATMGLERFQNGGGSLSNIPILSGVENAPCGADAFTFDWEGGRLQADWHVKSGGNTRAPETCLRIYYAFDAATGQIVVAEMPAHRRTGAT